MKYLLVTASLLFTFPALAETFDVRQKDKAFVAASASSDGKNPKLVIKKGDTVRFHNDDDFFHNVFSLSDAKLFDLGSYPKGDYRDITFDEAGTVEVECAIHPNMLMTIEIK